MPSSDYLKDINQEVLDLIDSRDATAGMEWINPEVEPLDFFFQNTHRKAFVIKKVFEREGGNLKGEALKGVVRETLELLGYAYLLYRRLKDLEYKG